MPKLLSKASSIIAGKDITKTNISFMEPSSKKNLDRLQTSSLASDNTMSLFTLESVSILNLGRENGLKLSSKTKWLFLYRKQRDSEVCHS